MGNSIKTRIVKIGNSKGIRIPKTLLDQAQLSEEIEVEVQGNKLIISSAGNPRQGWDEQFAEMNKRGDDSLLDPEAFSLSTFDSDEWEWE